MVFTGDSRILSVSDTQTHYVFNYEQINPVFPFLSKEKILYSFLFSFMITVPLFKDIHITTCRKKDVIYKSLLKLL